MAVNNQPARATAWRLAVLVAAAAVAGCGGPGVTAASSGGARRAPAAPSTTARSGGFGRVVAVRVMDTPALGLVLAAPDGHTLYRFSAETAGGVGTIACEGPCTATWHPLRVPSGDLSPVPGPGVPGSLGEVVRPDGTAQVTWDGSPLYTYAGDTAAGQTSGQGIDHQWSAIRVGRAGN